MERWRDGGTKNLLRATGYGLRISTTDRFLVSRPSSLVPRPRLTAFYIVLTVLLLAVTVANAQTGENSPFGFHPATVAMPGYAHNGLSDAHNIGVKWTRQGLYAFWFLVQPDLDDTTLDFALYDAQWSAIPPEFHILANVAPQGHIDEGRCLPGSWWPVDTAKYIRFVRRTVERYDGDGVADMPGLTIPITYWQVGNEPNDSTVGDFAGLQRITYQAIKDANPNAVVLIGGVPGMPRGYIRQFDSFYAPILYELAGNYVDVFDFHWYGTARGDYLFHDALSGEDAFDHVRATLADAGFPADLPIWITEMGSYSGDPTGPMPYQNEQEQAADYLKRHVVSLSRGIGKVFCAWGLAEGFKLDSGYFDYTGLIYDGWGPYDLGVGIKKLGYYTYKKMTEELEGVDWSAAVPLRAGEGFLYATRLPRADTSLIVAWWDWFSGPGYSPGDTAYLPLSGLSEDSLLLTEMVPRYTTGSLVTDYATAFTTRRLPVVGGSVTVPLTQNPVLLKPITPLAIRSASSPDALPEVLPTPFRGECRIAVPLSGSIVILDLHGAIVASLLGNGNTGAYIRWRPDERVPAGIYFIAPGADAGSVRKVLYLGH